MSMIRSMDGKQRHVRYATVQGDALDFAHFYAPREIGDRSQVSPDGALNVGWRFAAEKDLHDRLPWRKRRWAL